MFRIVAYPIFGAFLGAVLWILVFSPGVNDSGWLHYGVPLGALLGLVIAISLNYKYRNYIQPPVQPDLSLKGFVTTPGGWRFLSFISILICLLLAYIISAITSLDFGKVFIVLLIISIIPTWVVLDRLGSK